MATAFIVSTEYFIDPDFPVNENYMSHVICDFSGDFIQKKLPGSNNKMQRFKLFFFLKSLTEAQSFPYGLVSQSAKLILVQDIN